MNARAGLALLRQTWLSWLADRAFFFLLAFGWMVPPLVYLFVWSAASGDSSLGGYTRGAFVAHYLILVVVNQLTFAQTNWTVGDLIREGYLSPLLLYPVSPLYTFVTGELAGKAVYLLFVLPVTAVLALVLHPELQLTLFAVLAFLPALLLAWLLRFLWGFALADLAFWATRADALLALQNAFIFLLSGQVAPIALLPPAVRLAAVVLPFRYMLSFPVEVLTGHLTRPEMAIGFALQTAWTLLAYVAWRATWRHGLRRYTSIGG
ncbi:MAG: ABC transporter permease [Anaerolineae bacterium]